MFYDTLIFYFFKKKFGKMKAMFWDTGVVRCLVVEFWSSFTLLGQVALPFPQMKKGERHRKGKSDVLPQITVSELKI